MLQANGDTVPRRLLVADYAWVCCHVVCRMVRLITAGLVEVGHGRISPAQFKGLLAKGDRSGLPVEAAPPNGLYLTKVSC